ncbi:hypothetical protein [Fodinibius sp.]|nr:hypothetical protein [Fodinibius sp.]MDZ7659434.1 hypothetical protein [Fodinibius sp.]
METEVHNGWWREPPLKYQFPEIPVERQEHVLSTCAISRLGGPEDRDGAR